ncbi:DNA-binding response regulator [Pedobacter sandarakinus]|uniref:DNA-binding response regulator n=1 Tax=Pedobacter sandarakinus TaxID=353156 RepID=UPI002247E1A6|nr:response regulator [Pedobacter sandarakinus]MCX2574065.1 response regulator [Pedobacter sandarakinus]
MFKKVLIAEDHESINISVQKTLQDLGIPHDPRNYVFYCDDALLRIKKAIVDQQPYELLITDLSFEEDLAGQQINTGQELIKAAREIQPEIKVLVFSVDKRNSVATALMKTLGIDAYVPKARRDSQDLKLAIEAIAKGKKYLSPNLKRTETGKDYDFIPIDIAIITLLAEGKSQKEIPAHFQGIGITYSLSSIEKRLKAIKETLEFTKNEQLVAYCKDIKLI